MAVSQYSKFNLLPRQDFNLHIKEVLGKLSLIACYILRNQLSPAAEEAITDAVESIERAMRIIDDYA